MLGLPIFHVLVLIMELVGIALPFVQVAHARHGRALLVVTMGLTIVSFVVFLWFGSHVSGRSDLVLLRCYAVSSSFCSLADTLFSSARDEETPMRIIILLLFGVIFLLELVCLIGGISGAF